MGRVLCRDEAQLAAVRAAAGEVALLGHPRLRSGVPGHTGRPTKLTRRAEFRSGGRWRALRVVVDVPSYHYSRLSHSRTHPPPFFQLPPGGWPRMSLQDETHLMGRLRRRNPLEKPVAGSPQLDY